MARLNELQFPALIVAPDGWVMRLTDAGALAMWNARGVARYNRIGFFLLDRQGQGWTLRSVLWSDEVSSLERIVSRIFGRARPAVVELDRSPGLGLESAKVFLCRALAQDDGVLTQFATKQRIRSVVDAAKNPIDLMESLRKLRVVD